VAPSAWIHRQGAQDGRTRRRWVPDVVQELFSTGKTHSFGGSYTELNPHERISYTDKFEDPSMPGEMKVTISFRAGSCGTEFEIVQEGLPSVIPVELCYLGWQESLLLLAHLVEPEIPDGA
jgi:uncharacterized protein YndB with AHSA1/START domain